MHLHSGTLGFDNHLVSVELSFLAESWRHVLGLRLLLSHVVLVLVEEMLVLNLVEEDRSLKRRPDCVFTTDHEHWASGATAAERMNHLVGLNKGLGPHVEL